ncbi:Three prime repair exonuclease [Fasciola hepatica]|uniref:Three prime repair exonuclease n=1 Tax=Fasciola hepatica TaxID=6192 RepID=A0A4E0RB46_FASHE|nr:Three prime repair exonuclease [Fasciola hepatica]
MPQKPVLLSTIVFFDLETTGLPRCGFKPEITELCMLAVSRFALEQTDASLRVQNKLTICCRPRGDIQRQAASISGLDKNNLFHQKEFDSTAVELIQAFISRLDPPICVVAHNGNRFDFPLLRTELASVRGCEVKLFDHTGSPILCADSVHLFRDLADLLRCLQSTKNDDSGLDSSLDCSFSDSSQPPSQSSPKKVNCLLAEKESFRLTDVYSRVFGSVQKHAHNAEGDCLAVMELVQYLGLAAIDWLQVNYIDFNHFPYMYPPINLSTITDSGRHDLGVSTDRSVLGETESLLETIKLE